MKTVRRSPVANPYLIIDGYNLMHAAGIARKNYATGDLGRCRNRLEIRVAESLSSSALARTTIVYDAFGSPGNDNRASSRHGLKILFAPQGQDADGEIEHLLNHHSSPRQVIVVSSDHRLHKAAQRRKAKCVDSEVFLQEIESESSPGSTTAPIHPSKPISETDEELQKWASTFHAPETPEPDAPTSFDEDYLRRLERDLKDGNF